ncbi:MAG: hypothetical protein JRF65_14015 [Deltaproteobacteria bacterium]|nr:hypothetical protein [Deltaproteobacteria bacterium]
MPHPPLQELYNRLRKEGHFPFVVMFSWDFEQDAEAVDKLGNIFDKLPEGIPRDGVQAFYLTGARSMVVSGYTKSPVQLQRFCSAMTFQSAIEADVFHAVEVHELMGFTRELATG